MKKILCFFVVCMTFFVYSKDIATKLKRLHYSFETPENHPFHIVRISGGNTVCVGKNYERNLDNQISLRFASVWFGFFTANQIQQLQEINKKAATGQPRWITTFQSAEQPSYIIYEYVTNGECSDTRLAEIITMIAKVRFPIRVDSKYQNKMAISEVLKQYTKIFQTSATFNEKIKQIKSLNLSLCPQDFQTAYIDFCNAIQNGMRKATANIKNGQAFARSYGQNEQEVAGATLLSVLIHAKVLKDELKKYSSEMLRIAENYGVDVSDYQPR